MLPVEAPPREAEAPREESAPREDAHPPDPPREDFPFQLPPSTLLRLGVDPP